MNESKSRWIRRLDVWDFCDKIGRAFETGRTGEMGTETAKYGRSGLDEL
jgi:hypothetical protein